MTFVWIGLGAWLGFATGFIVAGLFYTRLSDTVMERHQIERSEWAAERRDLNNRIQVPEAAPFIDPIATAGPPVQHVPYDDDDAFNKAQEELSEWQ